MRLSPLLAVDCGASHVAIGRFHPHGGRLEVEDFATTPLVVSAPTDEGWACAIEMALRQIARGARGPCVLGLPGHLTLSKTLRLPRTSAWQRRKLIGFELAQSFPGNRGAVLWTEALVSADHEAVELVVTAVRRETMQALCSALHRAGWVPVAAVPAWRVARARSAGLARSGAVGVFVEIGARSTQLVSFGSASFLLRTLGIGGEGVTQAVAEQLTAGTENAESLKRNWRASAGGSPFDAAADMAVQLAADQFLRRLEGELRRAVACLGPGGGTGAAAVLHLAGGGSLLVGLSGKLGENLGLRVGRREGVATLEEEHRADLAGIAACALERHSGASRLLPAASRRRFFVRRWWPALAAAAALAVAGPLALGCALRSTARKLHAEGTELGAEVLRLRRLETRQRAAVADLAEANRRLAALDRIHTARTSWAALAADLQDRLARTQDAWLERLQVATDDPPRAAASPKSGNRPGGANSRPATAPRLVVGGCLFDPDHPMSKPGEGCFRRAKALLEDLRGSPFVEEVGDERFDIAQPGLLRFEVTLVLRPGKLL